MTFKVTRVARWARWSTAWVRICGATADAAQRDNFSTATTGNCWLTLLLVKACRLNSLNSTSFVLLQGG
jgi:hypothetical protein